MVRFELNRNNFKNKNKTMFIKLKKSILFRSLILSVLVSAMSVFFVSGVVFAEGDVLCSGKIIGQSESYGADSGINYFNSHIGLSDANEPVDLSIALGAGQMGLAPKYREYAACVSKDSLPDRYQVEGWSWNDKIGFVSYYCGASGQNPEEDHNPNLVDTDDDGMVDSDVSPVSCGGNQYGVKVGGVSAGKRPLTGYAWSPTYGYIEFEDQNAGDGIDYGVELDSSTHLLSGYAWTEAGVYLNFTGVEMHLPGETAIVTSECGPPRSVCFTPNPLGYIGSHGDPALDPSLVGDDMVRIADGKDGYGLELYLLRDDGVTPIDLSRVDLMFNWKDTVKLDQLSGSTGDFSDKSVSSDGGVLYKPIHVGNGVFSTPFLNVFEECDGDGDPITDPGHYCLKDSKLIRSYAPTSNENTSLTTSTDPAFPVQNDKFFSVLSSPLDIELNRLSLLNVSIKVAGVVLPPMYPNGTLGMSGDGLNLRFRPAVDVDPLYSDDHEDVINVIRGIPNAYKVGLKRYGDLAVDDANIDIAFKLDYSPSETKENPGCSETPLLFQFLTDFEGNDLDIGENGTSVLEVIGSVLSGSVKELSSIMTVDGEACKELAGPTLYSQISYSVAGKMVKYFSNKLPRIVSKASNSVVVVHGNVYAPQVFTPAGGEDAPKITKTGNVDTNVFRNIVYYNIDKFLGDVVDLKPRDGGASKTCTVDRIYENNGNVFTHFSGSGCTVSTKELTSKSGEREHLIFFDNTDVVLNLAVLPDGQSDFEVSEPVTIVVNGGNLFIDNDVYRDVPENLALIVLGPYSSGCTDRGNVYMGHTVRNIQANIATDCSVFSYKTGDRGNIGEDGLYDFADGQSLSETLGQKQLLIEGSVSSFNTIGGAEPDVNGNIRDGFGEIYDSPTIDQRRRAQQFDLNYLRLFSMDIKTDSETGLPFDFSCEKYLTLDEILAIKNWDGMGTAPVFGENGSACDGIDPSLPVSKGGDLVPTTGVDSLAKKLTEADTDPVYIFFRPAKSLFLKILK